MEHAHLWKVLSLTREYVERPHVKDGNPEITYVGLASGNNEFNIPSFRIATTTTTSVRYRSQKDLVFPVQYAHKVDRGASLVCTYIIFDKYILRRGFKRSGRRC